MQAVVLAGGEGSRLRPLTKNRPKAMIRVGNRPILASTLDALLKNGIREIVVVAGYRSEQVLDYLGRLELEVDVVIQERQLGTAHALACARDRIHGDFLVLPGDNWIDAASIAKIKGERNAMLVKEHAHPSNFGVVRIRDGKVVGIREKPTIPTEQTVSTGILSLTPSFFDCMFTTEIPDALMEMIARGIEIRAIEAEQWHDALVPWDLLRMNALLLQRTKSLRAGTIERGATIRNHVAIGKGSVIHPSTTIVGPCVIGKDARIGPNVTVMPNTSIGSRVTIEPHALVSDSIVMDDVTVGSHCSIVSAVIGEGCTLEKHVSTVIARSPFRIGDTHWEAEFGAIVGDHVDIAPFTVLKNCIVGNDVTIEEGRTIRGTLPDNSCVM
ncbi:MAG: sugar phosphate nucleotidyltransferase [Methanomicrobiales archaeon]|nr:sugar phosphate nucleotidyltransferase [Methanomicrobiales archaeon]